MMKTPGTAAVLSFLIPGVGQIYNGTFWRAIFWLIITPGLWIGSGGTLGWICHIISAYTAYSCAKSQQRILLVRPSSAQEVADWLNNPQHVREAPCAQHGELNGQPVRIGRDPVDAHYTVQAAPSPATSPS